MSNERIERRFVPALTGIRGIAALWVVLAHVPSPVHIVFPSSEFGNLQLIKTSYLGVDLFFILSGFVLSFVYSKSFAESGLRASSAFYSGRILRVWPLNFVALCLVALVAVFIPILEKVTHDLPSFIASIFLVQQWVYHRGTIWNIPAWSLSAEAFAYVVFPIISIAVGRIRSALALVVLMCGSLALFGASNWYLHGNEVGLNVANWGAFSRCLCEFTAGVLLFHAMINSELSPGARRLIEIFSVIVLCLGIWTPVTILAPLAFCGLIFSCFKGGYIEYLFSRRIVLWLGTISFSLYLTHWLVLSIFEYEAVSLNVVNWHFWVKIILAICCGATILSVAHITYKFIENPSHQLAKYITRRTRSESKLPSEKAAYAVADERVERVL
ncbi:acyltransferase family protein [Methylocapsa aurea]|uniref:acyltransferase family protein n=1 Tax=Methylocapsa aurea TaxID=663610 RepID=UPI000A029137|nr:acyltransferase [Methylocapsa aurea]